MRLDVSPACVRSAVGRRARAAGAPDAGLTLVELMAAIVVFAIAASGIAAGFTAAVKASGTDRDRVTAANLAQRELEIVRNDFNGNPNGPTELLSQTYAVNPNPLPGGSVGEPLEVDGREYTVTRTIQLLPSGVGQSPCDGGAEVTYPSFSVQVQVTWPNQPANVKPVESNTALTPRKGFIDNAMSYVAVKVLGSDGLPNPGRTVRLTRNGGTMSTATTAADGCAVLYTTQTDSHGSSHTVVLDEDGYVDNYGAQRATRTVVVDRAGSFHQLGFSYDAEANLPVRLFTDPGHQLPAAVPVTLGNTGFTLGTKSFPVPGGATTLTDLWPAQDGYSVWAGSCRQSDPADAGGVRDEAIVIPPGGTGDQVDVRLAPVSISLFRTNGQPRNSRQLVAYPMSSNGCAADENPIQLGTVSSQGRLLTALPPGAWRIEVPGRTSPDPWPETPVLLTDSPVTEISMVSS